MPTVFILAQDWKLRTNVRAELRELGVEAMGFESVDAAGQAIAGGASPAACVVEGADEYLSHPALQSLAGRAPVLLIASQQTDTGLLPNAAAVLRRPVSVREIVQRVVQLLQGQAV